jgi:hypothetical protein
LAGGGGADAGVMRAQCKQYEKEAAQLKNHSCHPVNQLDRAELVLTPLGNENLHDWTPAFG